MRHESEFCMELKSVTTGYGDVAVVRNVDMSFSPKVITAVIGSNGAGKSTVINALAGLLPIWSGKVFINGEDVTIEEPHKRRVALCCQK